MKDRFCNACQYILAQCHCANTIADVDRWADLYLESNAVEREGPAPSPLDRSPGQARVPLTLEEQARLEALFMRQPYG